MSTTKAAALLRLSRGLVEPPPQQISTFTPPRAPRFHHKGVHKTHFPLLPSSSSYTVGISPPLNRHYCGTREKSLATKTREPGWYDIPETLPRKTSRGQKKRDLQKKRADLGKDLDRIRKIPVLPRSLPEDDDKYRPDGNVEAWCVGAAFDMEALRERFFTTDFVLTSPISDSFLQSDNPGGLAKWLKKNNPARLSKKRSDDLSSSVRKRKSKPEPNRNPVIKSEGRLGNASRLPGSSQIDREVIAARKGLAIPPLELKITSVFDEVLFAKVGTADVFLFSFGVIVSWGLSEVELIKLNRLLSPYTFQPAARSEVERDEMKFLYWDAISEGGRPPIRKDTFPLVTSNTFEKLAYSYGFAQSTKLSVFESIVDNTIDKTKRIPESLARYGTTWMSRRNIAKQLGQLFVLRCNVNLQTDILDTPEILWDFDEWESLYVGSKRYLGVEDRVRILNQRLDVIKDLYNILNDELGVQQSHREGLIIITLISLELFVEIFKELLDIPAIATLIKDMPSIIKNAATASPFKAILVTALASIWIASPIKQLLRGLRAKWAYENSLSVARAGGAMYLPGGEDGMVAHMVGRLIGTDWGKQNLHNRRRQL